MQLMSLIRSAALVASLVLPVTTLAAVLPEDRADVMYHGYEGGGLQVDGPSVLVRKAYKDKVSVWANYYVDMITSASIDVVTTASEYSEQRDEQSVGIDYLTGKTFMGLSYTTSEESDYSSDSVRFGISQDFFGDLTTIGISYARGRDEVRRNGDETFAEKTDRQNYRVDLTQILTRSLVVSLNYEGITDEGFLNNPYRQVRFVDPREARGYAYQSELYPDTKTSSAFAVRGMVYLPWRASLRAEYRNYSDSWGVSAWNVEVGYTHPFDFGLTLEARYRYYDQTSADFYSDLFPFANSQNFLARDKELASFANHSVGAGATYTLNTPWLPFVERGSLNLFVDYMTFDYDDFRDVRVTGGAAGTEPLYSFDSLVLRAFVSLYF